MQLAREMFAVGTGVFHRGKSNSGADAALAGEFDGMREESHVAPVANFLDHIAIVEFVSDQYERQWLRASRGGFEQG